jgi:dienelactone hydrolase
MKKTKYMLLLILLFGILTVVGIIGLNFYPINITRSTHQVQSSEDIIISYNLYQPRDLTESTSVVIMGHGVMVDKEMMTNFALELAYNGFIVANLDWSGHGQSTGPLSNLTRDLEVVLSDIPKNAPLANMSELALMGYSMGGGPTYEYAVNNSKVKAWVGVGTWADGSVSNSTNPKNVLLIIGALDEAVKVGDLKAPMANLTGLSAENINKNTLYGNISDGTARKIQEVPFVDHLFSPWSRDFVVSSRDWICETFYGNTPNSMLVYDIRQVFVWLGLIGMIGLVFTSSYVLIKVLKIDKEDNNSAESEVIDINILENHSTFSFIGKYFLYTFLLLPSIFIFIPLVFTPLPMTGALIAIIGCLGFNLLIYMWRLGKRWNRSIIKLLKDNLIQNYKIWLVSILITLIYFFSYYLTIGLNYLGIIPSVIKIPLMIPLLVIIFFIFYLYNVFIQKFAYPFFDNKWKIKNTTIKYLSISAINFILVYSWFVVLILVPCIIINDYFLAQFLIIMFPIFLSFNFLSIFFEKLTKSPIINTIIHTILVGFLITSLMPYGYLLNFF